MSLRAWLARRERIKNSGRDSSPIVASRRTCTIRRARHPAAPERAELIQPGHPTLTGTVAVTVTPENDASGAQDDSTAGVEDTPLSIAAAAGVLANDSAPDGDVLGIAGYTQPGGGSVVLNPDGAFTYSPAADFNGTDSFACTIADAAGVTRTATASIQVAARDEPVVRAGGNGRDLLVGAGGDDRLSGDNGLDTLDGLGGNDILPGGNGPDRFILRGGNGQDRITDFRDEDIMVLPAGNPDLDGVAEVLARITDTAQGTLLDLGGGNAVLFEGVAKASFAADDFAFTA
ncbi:Ig-like domain-containing protein [Dankookia sp. GCM10030260]|uniref:Ig-like domain-containing protein n=1 Tax=Dankookia sp. GCM10030260 TaxID=3273390 RepID=UPI00361528DC